MYICIRITWGAKKYIVMALLTPEKLSQTPGRLELDFFFFFFFNFLGLCLWHVEAPRLAEFCSI